MTETEVLEWYKRAWSFVYRHGYGGALAEDLVHEMMVDVLAHPTRRHHLHFVLLHAQDRVVPRVQQHGERRRPRYVSDAAHETAALMDFEDRLSIDELLQRCPVKHQWWLRLVVFEDWDLKDIAVHDGVTPNAISMRLNTLAPFIVW